MKEHTHQSSSGLSHHENYDTVGSIATNVADGFTMVAVGDLILSRPLAKGHHPGFGDIVKVLHDADV
ncbi:MAG: CapA family protein, partial [Mesorhizobium sp.]